MSRIFKNYIIMNYYINPGIEFVATKEKAFNKVCEVFKLTAEQLRSRRRFRNIIDAKSMLCFVLHKKFNLTSTETGSFLNLDHATILHHCKKAEGLIETDKEFKEKFKQLRLLYNN